jgi:hypothetical protein
MIQLTRVNRNLITVIFALVGSAASAADNKVVAPTAPDTSYRTPVSELRFYDAGGIPFARAYGDPAAEGLHSNYIKMPGGAASSLHTHSNDYYGVVISGVVANEPAGSKEDHPLPAGSYWFQQGGKPHTTKCISQGECLFFVTQVGHFDFKASP